MLANNDNTVMFVKTDTIVQVLVNNMRTENIDTTSIEIGLLPTNGLAVFDTLDLIATYTPNKGFVGKDSLPMFFVMVFYL